MKAYKRDEQYHSQSVAMSESQVPEEWVSETRASLVELASRWTATGNQSLV